jgi:tetrapyrrole methylase family protein / MazG family protein
MDEFNSLISTLERLLGPDGCPWDREQTLQSLRHTLLEEAYEVIEAIDLDNNLQMEEELGDLLLNIVFLCKIAEKEGRFTLKDVLRHVVAKLVRRHPHIFGEKKLKTSEEVLRQWEIIKQAEKRDHPRHSTLDGIPKDLPTLARAQKVAKKLSSKQFVSEKKEGLLTPEEQAGELLWASIQHMSDQGIQPEQALRRRLTQIEAEFRSWEQTMSSS